MVNGSWGMHMVVELSTIVMETCTLEIIGTTKRMEWVCIRIRQEDSMRESGVMTYKMGKGLKHSRMDHLMKGNM
jgi:hypothetical protein